MKEYYIYAHIGEGGEVIYIGKGGGDRAYRWTARTYSREEVEDIVILPMRYTDENLAYEIERIITQHYKDLGQCKYNINIGNVLSEETKEKISKANKRREISKETRKKIARAMKGKNPYANKTEEEMKEIKKKISEGSKRVWSNRTEEEIKEIGKKRSEAKKGEKNPRATKVRCVETGEVFSTLKKACEWCGLKNVGNISLCCRGKRKTAGGYHWEYVERENENSL